MSEKRRGLGRGLGALIPSSAAGNASGNGAAAFAPRGPLLSREAGRKSDDGSPAFRRRCAAAAGARTPVDLRKSPAEASHGGRGSRRQRQRSEGCGRPGFGCNQGPAKALRCGTKAPAKTAARSGDASTGPAAEEALEAEPAATPSSVANDTEDSTTEWTTGLTL